jgi:hypothetical protein
VVITRKIFTSRPVERKILSNPKNPRVGYWTLEKVCELAHFYHQGGQTFEHRFCYRNFYPETFVLSRDGTVTGPAQYERGATFDELTIEARPLYRNPEEMTEQPPCARLLPNGQGDVHTVILLKPTRSYSARLPDEIRLTSHAHIGDLEACCKR